MVNPRYFGLLVYIKVRRAEVPKLVVLPRSLLTLILILILLGDLCRKACKLGFKVAMLCLQRLDGCTQLLILSLRVRSRLH